jgi:serine/threonine-protein kinase RsbW
MRGRKPLSMSDANTNIDEATTVELTHDRARISKLIDSILSIAEEKGFGSSSIFAIRLAIEEAITNAFEHGHEGLEKSLSIQVDYSVSSTLIEIAVEDQGPGFSPSALPDPTLQENLSKPSGRGVMLMQAYMSEVLFNAKGNRVKMKYIRPRE